MIIGSHNSWSYLTPTKWWMKLLAFTAKCQSVDLNSQYEKYNVRCFDLRVRFDDNGIKVVHGSIEYKYSYNELMDDLKYLNSKEDCYIRLIHDARTKNKYTEFSEKSFIEFCANVEQTFKNIKFWCGRNLYNWNIDYEFTKQEPTCSETYSSVCSPKIIDDWWPWLFAIRNNKKFFKEGTDKDILLIDFVNYGN